MKLVDLCKKDGSLCFEWVCWNVFGVEFMIEVFSLMVEIGGWSLV